MVKPTPITIPTQPIGRILRPVEPMERVKKGNSEDRKLALFMTLPFETPWHALRAQALLS
jgi:hypothetical protein